MTVLVLAGTAEATALVNRLVEHSMSVVASLAGRTSAPLPLPCPVRQGGFGGVDGLAAEIRERKVAALVDATHPYAGRMPAQAQAAAQRAGVPHLRLIRAAWPRRDTWTEVADLTEAAAVLAASGSRRALLTIGRQQLEAFRHLDGTELVVRSVDPPPDGPWTAVVARGPFTYDDELALLRGGHIDMLVTRNSGGPAAKLDAADTAGVGVIIVRRPAPVDAPTVEDVDAAVTWVLRRPVSG